MGTNISEEPSAFSVSMEEILKMALVDPPKHWYAFKALHCITSKKTVISA
jgi:hypothetical protein